jgi:hypothetical protein
VKAAAKIDHPHLQRIYDIGRTSRGLLYVVTEILDGAPLASWLKQSLRLPVSLAIDVTTQVLDALVAAHQHGLVHRDLTPESIYVLNRADRPNFVKITDFGVSHLVAAPKERAAATRATGVAAGMLFGSPPYMSAELIRGPAEAVDHRGDLYAAGVVLYQMLCGSTPYHSEDLGALLREILEGSYSRPRTLRPEIPAGIETVVVCALERDKYKRFATAAAMRDALARGASKAPPGSASAEALPDNFVLEPATLVDTKAVRPAAPPPPPPASPPLPPPPPPSASVPLAVPPTDSATQWTEAPPLDAAPLRLGMTARARAQARDRGTHVAAVGRPRRDIPWRPIVIGVVVASIAGAIGLGWRRKPPPPTPAIAPLATPSEEIQKFLLIVYPETASVTIDHVPVSARELPIESGTPRAHEMKVAAPGRQTRIFSFTATAGMKLIVRLGRTLPAPTAADPPPLPAELAAEVPATPRPAAEIDRAFAQLDRYAVCLALTTAVNAEARRGGQRDFIRGADFEPCRHLANESPTGEPRFPTLPAAAQAYVHAALDEQKPETLVHMASRFRAEFLAERTVWQMQELALVGKDDGQTLPWQMRRVALTAQAWVRARRAGVADERGAEARAAKLDAYVRALADTVRSRGLGNLRGAEDFLRSARELVALARPKAGAKVTDANVYEACLKLMTDFDALVLD